MIKLLSLFYSFYILVNFASVTEKLANIDLNQDSWYLLADVKIEKRWDDLLQEERDFPIFGDRLADSNGQVIELNGYMVPLDELIGQNHFVISSLPFQTCFFCGGAGPETVAEIRTKKTISFTEKKIKVKGRLKLNDSDPSRLYYTLEESEVIR